MNGATYLEFERRNREQREREERNADDFQKTCAAAERLMNEGREGAQRKRRRVDCEELHDWLLKSGLKCEIIFAGYQPATGRLDTYRGWARDFTKHYILNVRREATWEGRDIRTPEERASFPFQQGSAFGAAPSVAGIMACVGLDAGTRDDYDDAGAFIDDMCFDRATEGLRCFEAMTKVRDDLQRVLTPEQYDSLIEIAREHY